MCEPWSFGFHSAWDDLLGTGAGQEAGAMTGPPVGRARFGWGLMGVGARAAGRGLVKSTADATKCPC